MTADLARELVAHSRWRWRAGMRVRSVVTSCRDLERPVTCVLYPDCACSTRGTINGYEPPIAGRVSVAWDGGVVDSRTDPARISPDLADDATAGVLLGMLRAQVAGVQVTTDDRDDRWTIAWAHRDDLRTGYAEHGSTLGAALAAALLSAWGPADAR